MESIEHIGIMPLHAITEVHGESGLRDRFDFELERFGEEEKLVLASARDLALHLHGQQERSREPYNNHILRNAIRVMAPTHYGVYDTDVIVAMLLHDGPEDHARKLCEIGGTHTEQDATKGALRVIADRYGERPSMIVGAVTNPEFDREKGDWRVEYREHVEESMLTVPEARIVKVSDFSDNGLGVIYTPPDRQMHFATKYSPLVEMFRRVIALPDTPLSARAKVHIFGQLDLAEERFNGILGQEEV